jgi:hypothetical protein
MKAWYPPSVQDCALCGAPTHEAMCGNRLLSRWEVRDPPDLVPTISWRCERHQRSVLRLARAVRASEQGDLLFLLQCRHEVRWVLRGVRAYTPPLVAQQLASGQIRLDQFQRCYQCGDLEQPGELTR